MEDVLDLYQQPYDPRYPQVCFDEGYKHFLGEHRQPLPPAPGLPMRYDYTYFPAGGANLFMTFEPLQGKRDVLCFSRRTKRQWALWVKPLLAHSSKLKLLPGKAGVINPLPPSSGVLPL